MQQYVLKESPVRAVQWFKMGDHGAVILHQCSDKRCYICKGKNEKTPVLPITDITFISVLPGDWIIETDRGIIVRSDNDFKKTYSMFRPDFPPDEVVIEFSKWKDQYVVYCIPKRVWLVFEEGDSEEYFEVSTYEELFKVFKESILGNTTRNPQLDLIGCYHVLVDIFSFTDLWATEGTPPEYEDRVTTLRAKANSILSKFLPFGQK